MMKKFLNVLYNIIVSFIILTSALYIMSVAQVRFDPSHVPSIFGFAPLTVVSESMSPGIKTGDMVVIWKGNKNLNAGDVVTYRLDDMLVTHRIKTISDSNELGVFITQGDANKIPDYKVVERSQIVGKYVFKIPMGGYIKANLRGLPGILILMGLILISIMLEVLKRTKLKLEKLQETF